MRFTALPTDAIRALQAGGPDANGMPSERAISDGDEKVCRHCLKNIPAGRDMLILAYRPFEDLHPYAESGPLFLCADACAQGGGTRMPEILENSPDYLLKGYNAQDRIVYGTGAIVASADIPSFATEVFEDDRVAYIHVRSARNNCYQARIDRD